MNTSKCVVSALGVDEPGVVATLCKTLTAAHCNISEMTQSNLHNQFASLFIIEKPSELDNEELKNKLCSALKTAGLHVTARVWDPDVPPSSKVSSTEPFVISVYGGDRNDIVGTFASIFAEEKINIEDLRALQPEPGEFMIVYEVLVPTNSDVPAVHAKLLSQAKRMGLNLTMQHRDIFEAIHRVQVV